METFDFFPLVRGDIWHKLKSERTWTCGHRFSLDSWHRIYNDIILFQSWDDWLVTHFINKSESTYEVRRRS